MPKPRFVALGNATDRGGISPDVHAVDADYAGDDGPTVSRMATVTVMSSVTLTAAVPASLGATLDRPMPGLKARAFGDRVGLEARVADAG